MKVALWKSLLLVPYNLLYSEHKTLEISYFDPQMDISLGGEAPWEIVDTWHVKLYYDQPISWFNQQKSENRSHESTKLTTLPTTTSISSPKILSPNSDYIQNNVPENIETINLNTWDLISYSNILDISNIYTKDTHH